MVSPTFLVGNVKIKRGCVFKSKHSAMKTACSPAKATSRLSKYSQASPDESGWIQDLFQTFKGLDFTKQMTWVMYNQHPPSGYNNSRFGQKLQIFLGSFFKFSTVSWSELKVRESSEPSCSSKSPRPSNFWRQKKIHYYIHMYNRNPQKYFALWTLNKN